MRKLMIAFVVLLMVVPAWAAQPQTEDQKTLYALGALLTKQLSVFNLSVDEYEYVQQGMSDAAAGKTLAAEPEAYKQKITALAQTRMQAIAEKQNSSLKIRLLITRDIPISKATTPTNFPIENPLRNANMLSKATKDKNDGSKEVCLLIFRKIQNSDQAIPRTMRKARTGRG